MELIEGKEKEMEALREEKEREIAEVKKELVEKQDEFN